MSSKRKCHLSPDSFCYICKLTKQVFLLSAYITNCSQDISWHKTCDCIQCFFGVTIGNQDKTWFPHVCCESCWSMLEGWLRGKIKCMPLAILRIWREPTNHLNECYFCMVDVSQYRKSSDKKIIVYPCIQSSNLHLLQCHNAKIYPFLSHPC